MITSFTNPTVKRFRALAARKHRRRQGAFTVEGLQPVWRAVTSAWAVDTIVVAPELLTHERAWQMVDGARRAGTTVVEVAADVFAHLSGRDQPSGLAAIVTGMVPTLTGEPPSGPPGLVPPSRFPGFAPQPGRPIVALHEAGNPGNIGTILRSVDAAGGGGVLLAGRCADPLAPSAVKASMGSVFAVPIAELPDATHLVTWAAYTGRATVAVTGHTEHQLYTSPRPNNGLLLFGAEGPGLPDDLAEGCDHQVAIPMEGTAESLNLATATSLTMFELKRRRDLGQADGER